MYFRLSQKIWSKDDSYIIQVYYLPILWKGLEEREGEIENIYEIVFELHFWSGQLSYIRRCQADLKQDCNTSNFHKIRVPKTKISPLFL